MGVGGEGTAVFQIVCGKDGRYFCASFTREQNDKKRARVYEGELLLVASSSVLLRINAISCSTEANPSCSPVCGFCNVARQLLRARYVRGMRDNAVGFCS